MTFKTGKLELLSCYVYFFSFLPQILYYGLRVVLQEGTVHALQLLVAEL